MATKDDRLFLKENRKSNSFAANNYNQFTNLNLNQNYQSLTLNPVLSNSSAFEGYQNYRKSNGDYCYNKKDISLNKFSKDMIESKSFNLHHDFEDKNSKPSKSSAINSNSSTLSLHIAAYENSNQALNCNGKSNERISVKKSSSKKNKAARLVNKVRKVFERKQHEIWNYEIARSGPEQQQQHPSDTNFLSPQQFGELVSGRAFYTTFGVAAALSASNRRQRYALYLFRFVFGISLAVKLIKSWFQYQINDVSYLWYFILGGCGLCLGTFLSERFDNSRRPREIESNRFITTIRDRTTTFGLIPGFALSYLFIVIAAELSKPPTPFKTEFYGCLFDLLMFIISIYDNGSIIWRCINFLTTNDFPNPNIPPPTNF